MCPAAGMHTHLLSISKAAGLTRITKKNYEAPSTANHRELPGATRESQEPGTTRKHQEQPGSTKHQEPPGTNSKPEEASGNVRSRKGGTKPEASSTKSHIHIYIYIQCGDKHIQTRMLGCSRAHENCIQQQACRSQTNAATLKRS